MRLIDADALRKCAIPCEIHNGALTDMCVPLYQIDNAPTVDRQAINAEWFKAGIEYAKTHRPQGEWKLHGMIYYCSKCGHDYEQGGNNFCGNCGAYMRPKANQLRDCENCIHHSDNGCEVWDCEFEKRSDL